ncbi:hypothetical protein EUV02_15445 [Polymorphobacter arshaanensis]|uniref:Uncharacterized protein n=1 Tax=Glacieibacterium arshaanense TaxID=2511025 RepID=A0A4Y9EK82_9SPHN|nr:hypothetical protein [Polymorphobacter arshaanensis]TFU00040.1 hypothetical protein EUV02_15445 [Polymorphobacter arshaanensis]
MGAHYVTSPPQWWLNKIAALDIAHPGVAGFMLRTSNHRRQVSAAVLAASADDLDDICDDPDIVIPPRTSASCLISGRLEAVITETLGSCPQGFLAMLKRMGSAIAQPSLYHKLFAVYSNPDLVDVAHALREVSHPSIELLEVAEGCPAWLLKSGALRFLKNTRQRDDLLATVELLFKACPASSYQRLSESLRACASDHDVSRAMKQWFRQAVFPKPDINLGEAFLHVGDAVTLDRLGLEFRNCSATYRLEVLAGVAMFLRCRTPCGEYVTHLRRADIGGVWEYAGTHSTGNAPTPLSARQFAKDHVRNAGVIVARGDRELPTLWQPVERICYPDSGALDEWFFDQT